MATYYVKAGGNDSADGRSPANAWATIAGGPEASFGARIAAGDTILFRQGDTFTGQLYNCVKANVTLGSYDPNTGLPGSGRATLQNTTPDTVIGCPGATAVTIKDLEIKTNEATSGAGQHTIIANDAAAVCTNWVIQNCFIHQAGGNGILINNVGSTGWTITGNTIQDLGDNGVLFNACGGGHVISNNLIQNCGLFNGAQGRHGIYAHAPSYTIRDNEFTNFPNGQAISLRNSGASGNTGQAYRNYIHDTPFGIAFFSNSDTGTGTLRVFKNRLVNVGAGGGYGIYVGDGSTTFFDTVIASNTLVMNAAADVGISTTDILHANATVKNNIVKGGVHAYYGKNAALDAGKTITENYNCWNGQSNGTPFSWNGTLQTFANYKTNSSQSANSITADPLVSTYPLTPPSNSPVINTGTATVTGITYATSGNPDILYANANPDIGAVEVPNPYPRREIVPIQPGDWLAVNDYLVGITIGLGIHRETLPIQPGDWQALNDYLVDIPVGSAVVRERLPLQPGNWESLNQYLALL